MKRKTTKEFIDDCKQIHGDKYDYSLVVYSNNHTKVKIICPEHGVYEKKPHHHLRGQGCPICSGNKKYTNETFIKKSIKIHNDKYDYSLVEYVNNLTKVKIICPDHGIFEQKPNDHLMKHGCPKCKGLIGTSKFIERSNKIHNNKYDYSLVEYKHNNTKVKIICPEHGIYEQTPFLHMRGHGCSSCACSRGETLISLYLRNKNIKYINQYKFTKCEDKKELPFDFYLPEVNTCIEYDGIQHFEPIKYWGGDEKLKYTQKHDKIKNEYCSKNNIRLIRIRYDENIKEILANSINY